MRKTKNPDFSSVAEQLSVRAQSEIELVELKSYQLGLINFMVYELRGENNNLRQVAVTKEIQRVEIYLKKKWKDIIDQERYIKRTAW